jgi:hypothetical protein
MGDRGVADSDQVIHGLLEAGGVIGPDDIEAPVPHRARDHDDRHLDREVAEVRHRQLRAQQDQGLASVAEEAGDGSAFVTRWGDRAERDLVAGALRRFVESADQVAVEGVLDTEHNAYQPAPAAPQQLSAAVRTVAQIVGRPPHTLPIRWARSGRIPHDDRDQGDRHPSASRDVRQRHAPLWQHNR